MSSKIVLIDGHSILNRAFYGLPDLTNAEGLHTNAIYGFLTIMFKLLEEEKTDYLMSMLRLSDIKCMQNIKAPESRWLMN